MSASTSSARLIRRRLTDPLADITVLTDPETRLRLIMQGGKVKADRLGD